MNDRIIAKLDLIIRLQQHRSTDDLAIHTCITFGTEIVQAEVAVLFNDLGMLAADGAITAQIDIVLLGASDRCFLLTELVVLTVAGNQPGMDVSLSNAWRRCFDRRAGYTL